MVDGQGLGATLVGGGVHSLCSRQPSHLMMMTSAVLLPSVELQGALADLEHLPNQLGGHTSDLYMAMLTITLLYSLSVLSRSW